MAKLLAANLKEIAERTLKAKEGFRHRLMLCSGTGCRSAGSRRVKEALAKEIAANGLESQVQVVSTGCNGFCAQGPILVVHPEGIFYKALEEKDIAILVKQHLMEGKPVDRLMFRPPGEKSPVPHMNDIGFFARQHLIALRNRGLIDPEAIEDYISREGYFALAKVLSTMKPEQVIAEMKASGLRGRGGAGFPTGRKWELCREQVLSQGEAAYVICNGDEGDPGAFMDRSIIESDPHSVIEGMLIGAYAIGAAEGYAYIRNEYPLAISRMQTAIGQARELGLLGKDILQSGFSFDVILQRGAGAFVCGEETSLIASLEGRPPEPRQRPPFPAESGLWGKPTNINNVETWATVPPIMLKGAGWFSGIGTETSKGTKVFSLVGKVKNTGLVEVPMGIPLRSIVFDIGGGVEKEFKAVQTGGPSGGCIPASLLDLPIDYERLAESGSIMGSGGMIVMDEDTCMVDVARYFLDFLRDESCGKCTSCREGIQAMHSILQRICDGEGSAEDIGTLEELANAVKDASLCGLGKTAPNPVLSTLRYFRQEYEAHINERKCPAGTCKKLISYYVIEEKCTGCTACALGCPSKAIVGEKKKPHRIEPEKCIKCGACYEVCKFAAIGRR